MKKTNLKLARLDHSSIEKINIDYNKELYSKSILEIYKENYIKKSAEKLVKLISKNLIKSNKKIKNEIDTSKLEEIANKKCIFSIILYMKLSDFVLKKYLKSKYYDDHLKTINIKYYVQNKNYFECYKLNNQNFIGYFMDS